MRIILGLSGAFCCLYRAVSLLTNRLNTGVLAFWALGILLIIFAIFFHSIRLFLMKRKKLKAAFIIMISIGLISAAGLEAAILLGMKEQHPKTIDDIVVLGAGVKEGTPSPVLKARLQKTIEEHQKYPKAEIYVSGGLDTGEKKTEALVMKEYLVQHGVDSRQVVMENKATSTEENFVFTKKLMKTEHAKILVVTSDFHLLRAKYDAKEAGFEPYCAGAPIPLKIVPLTHIREILAVGYMLVRDGIQKI